MPFTLSHVAAVVPLARTKLPTTALVIGCLIPDFPIFLPVRLYDQTHSLGPGFLINVALGMVTYYLWMSLWWPAMKWTFPAWALRY